jgi:hypothetical protein
MDRLCLRWMFTLAGFSRLLLHMVAALSVVRAWKAMLMAALMQPVDPLT